MVQANDVKTVQTPATGPSAGSEQDDEVQALAVAVYAVTQQIRRLNLRDPVDRATLAVLWRVYEFGELRASEIAGDLGLDLSTISRHVRTLCDENYLARTPDPDDRRAYRLAVTPLGQDVIHQAWERRRGAIRRAVEGWSAEDRQSLITLLTRLAEDLTPKKDKNIEGNA